MAKGSQEISTVDYTYTLTDAELLEYGKRAADLEAVLDGIESDKKAAMAGFKARAGEVQQEQRKLMRAIADGQETRTGDCTVDCDYRTGKITYTLVETGEVVHVRPMTKDEFSLPFGGEDSGDE